MDKPKASGGDLPPRYPRDAHAVETWGAEISPDAAVVPIVYQFRPTHYVRVAADRLQEWEDYFVKNVGLDPNVRDSAARMGLDHRSASMSGSHHGWDDADFI